MLQRSSLLLTSQALTRRVAADGDRKRNVAELENYRFVAESEQLRASSAAKPFTSKGHDRKVDDNCTQAELRN